MQTEPIHPAVRIGHVHLRVADLDRSIAFYRDALGLGVTADGRDVGLDAAFLAAGDYHHHIGLNTWESQGAPAPPEGSLGLDRYELVLPDEDECDAAAGRVGETGDPVHTDDGVLATDPAGNHLLLTTRG
jgi:catechol 2,3-dioxygenase